MSASDQEKAEMTLSQDVRTAVSDGPAHPIREGGTRLLAFGGILAALGAASCCVLPFALFAFGISGAWIGNLTALEPYQPLFAGAAIGAIAYGLVLVRRRRVTECADGSYCANPRSDRIAKVGLWSAAALVAVAVAFPRLALLFL